MKSFFNEYSQVLVVIIVAVALIAICMGLKTAMGDSVTNLANSFNNKAQEIINFDDNNSESDIVAGLYVGDTMYRELTIADCGEDASKVWELITEDNTKVILPSGITSIAEYAFESCTSMVSIEIPNTVTSIGEGAFYLCNELTSVVLPNTITSIATNTFYFCASLTSVTIPDSVLSIGVNAFFRCSSLDPLIVPDTVTSIEEGAFDSVYHVYYNGSATGSPWGAFLYN